MNKKIYSLLISFFILSVSLPAFSEIIAKKEVNASVDFSSFDIHAIVSFKLKDMNNPAKPSVEISEITWDSKDIPLIVNSDNNWHNSNIYAELEIDITNPNAKVYMYTTNYKSSKYKARDINYCNGLINKDNYKNVPLIYMTTSTATMFSSTSSWTQATETSGEWKPLDPNTRYLSDTKSNGDDDSAVYITYNLIADVLGIAYGEWYNGSLHGISYIKNTDGTNAKKANIYFSGKFNNIFGREEYGTDQLHIVTVIDGD